MHWPLDELPGLWLRHTFCENTTSVACLLQNPVCLLL